MLPEPRHPVHRWCCHWCPQHVHLRRRAVPGRRPRGLLGHHQLPSGRERTPAGLDHQLRTEREHHLQGARKVSTLIALIASDTKALLNSNLCNAYAQLGARGTSILFASGDGGVAGSQTTRCTTFLPTFPSGCPL